MLSFHFKNYKHYEHLYTPWLIGIEKINTAYFTGAEQYSYTLYNTNKNAMRESFELADELKQECNKLLQEHKLEDILPGEGSPWVMRYNKGGNVREHIHPHQTPCYALVMSLSSIEEPTFFIDINGTRNFFNDTPGEVRLFRGDIYNHGTLPAPKERRVVVIDYTFKKDN